MANMTIGKLAVMLSANSSQFVSGVNRAGKSTSMFAATANRNLASVGGAMTSLGKAAMRLGPLLGVGLGIGTMVSQLQRLDEVGKTASRLGLATDELSRLQFAGEQTGVAVSTMNMALQRMTRRVAEAAAGTGEAKDAIAELGLDAAALNAMGPAKAFVALSEAIKGVKNPSDRVRLAMKLFDSEGVALVNTMALGAKGLQEMGKRSDELGNTVSDKAAKSAAEFNDAINELKRAIGGAAGELVTSLIPAIKSLVSMATGAAKAVGWLGKQLSFLFSGNIMGDWRAPGEIAKVTKEAEEAAAAVKAMREEMQRLTDIEGNRQMDAIFDRFKGTAVTTFSPVIDNIVSQFDRIAAAIEDARSRAASIFEATRTPAEKMAAKLKEIKQLMSEGFLDPDTAMRAIAQLNERQQQAFMQQPMPELTTNRVSFAALGAEGAAGFKQDKVEKNTAEEVKESKKQTKALAELLRIGTNSQGAAITLVNF